MIDKIKKIIKKLLHFKQIIKLQIMQQNLLISRLYLLKIVNKKGQINSKVKVNNRIKIYNKIRVKVNNKVNLNNKVKVNNKIKIHNKVKDNNKVKVKANNNNKFLKILKITKNSLKKGKHLKQIHLQLKNNN